MASTTTTRTSGDCRLRRTWPPPDPERETATQGGTPGGGSKGQQNQTHRTYHRPGAATSATVLAFPEGGPVEIAITRDEWRRAPCGGWGTFPSRPPGPGWVVVDSTHDKRTRWRRTPDAKRGER
jgi:hypothetical protein